MNKKAFSVFNTQKNLIYFDSAATSQTPDCVVNAMVKYYTQYKSNTGRGIYAIAEQATAAVEDVRKKVAQFINASDSSEIIFTAGATAGINFVAQSWVNQNIKKGDEIVITALEHHANFVVWQQLCKKKQAILKVIPVDKKGRLSSNAVHSYITKKTKLVAVTHVSNVLGTVNPYLHILQQQAEKVGAAFLVDGAQAVATRPVDVQKLKADFYVFSGHKMYGPTGIGILYINKKIQPSVKPAMFGGGAVFSVEQEATILADAPACYEPGTLPVAQIIGLGAAIEYIEKNGILNIFSNSNQLVNQLIDGLKQYSEVTIIGDIETLRKESTMVSFVIDKIHAHDIAAFFDAHQICIRAGHHCAQPLLKHLGYQASVRVSFSSHNDKNEITFFLETLNKLLHSGIL